MTTPRDEIVTLMKARLGANDERAGVLADAYLGTYEDHAVIRAQSTTIAPTSMATHRLELVELLAARLKRLPTVRELSALLRITESTARSVLRNVVVISDRAAAVALTAFESSHDDGNADGMKRYKFDTQGDMQTARDELEKRGIKFETKEESDGVFVLAVDNKFDPRVS